MKTTLTLLLMLLLFFYLTITLTLQGIAGEYNLKNFLTTFNSRGCKV